MSKTYHSYMTALTGMPVAGEPYETDVDDTVTLRREQFKCPHFRILVMGRANAGKTTILEKVCGVARGTQPIIIYDMNNKEMNPGETHVKPSIERGMHDIEHQITYKGCNFIFHDSQGFESGAMDELEIVWNFIAKRSAAAQLKERLHAIWYCIPMDSPRPVLPTELEFFNKGTGNVPLVVAFTKFDGQIIQECGSLDDIEDDGVKWDMARKNAEITFQRVYLPKIFDTNHPPRAYVRLEDMDMPEKNCPELTEKTADAIDDSSLKELFVSTQMNNINLCVKAGLQHILYPKGTSNIPLEISFIAILSKFPHYWVIREEDDKHNEIDWFESADDAAGKEREYYDDGIHSGGYGYYGGKKISEKERDHRRDFVEREILPGLLSLFQATKFTEFSATATECQLVVAIIIIAKLSFWIKNPTTKSIIDRQPFEQLLIQAFDQFNGEGYANKLKVCITPESLPARDEGNLLLKFLYDQIEQIS